MPDSPTPGPGHDPSPTVPASGIAAWWLTAWLRGEESADETLERLGQGDAVLALLPAGPGTGVELLGFLRRAAGPVAGLALPVEGDPVGLGGPAAFNAAAIDAGEAVVCGAWGLVPHQVGEVVHWSVTPARPRQLPDLHHAGRQLKVAIQEAAEALADLDVARWRPEAADLLLNIHHPPVLDVPAGTPAACVDLAARASVARAVVEAALLDDGGALSVGEAERRTSILRPLATAARHALVAACSPEGWPPPTPGTVAR